MNCLFKSKNTGITKVEITSEHGILQVQVGEETYLLETSNPGHSIIINRELWEMVVIYHD